MAELKLKHGRLHIRCRSGLLDAFGGKIREFSAVIMSKETGFDAHVASLRPGEQMRSDISGFQFKQNIAENVIFPAGLGLAVQ